MSEASEMRDYFGRPAARVDRDCAGASSTACDDQLAAREATRDDAIDDLLGMTNPADAFAGQGSVRHLGHTITWGELSLRHSLSALSEMRREVSEARERSGARGRPSVRLWDESVGSSSEKPNGSGEGPLEQSMRDGMNRAAEKWARGDMCASVSKHYRHSVKVPVTAADLERGYAEFKLDPYRVCDVYDIGGGPREQMVKKLLRWTDKNQDEEQVLREIGSALDRWHEMRAEDSATKAQELVK